jgi:hypothetical protein
LILLLFIIISMIFDVFSNVFDSTFSIRLPNKSKYFKCSKFSSLLITLKLQDVMRTTSSALKCFPIVCGN